jgi:hypothetical protein
MRLVRALAGSVLWILAGVLGLVGLLLCVTVILLPLGIPALMAARKLFAMAMALILPRSVRHPVDELGKSARGVTKDAKKAVPKVKTKKLRKKVRKKLT